MTMLEKTKNNFDYNEPIILKELEFPDQTKVATRNAMKRLADQGKLKRYDNGIYYLPKETRLGQSSLSANAVVTTKYVNDKKSTFGYFTGLKLLNDIGLTTQVPNTFEVVSNKIKTNNRTTKVGKWQANSPVYQGQQGNWT